MSKHVKWIKDIQYPKEGTGNDVNVYGLILTLQDDNTFLPVMCGCGGSMYMCKKHADELIQKQEKET